MNMTSSSRGTELLETEVENEMQKALCQLIGLRESIGLQQQHNISAKTVTPWVNVFLFKWSFRVLLVC